LNSLNPLTALKFVQSERFPCQDCQGWQKLIISMRHQDSLFYPRQLCREMPSGQSHPLFDVGFLLGEVACEDTLAKRREFCG
jgi:hypothetical protein